MENKSIKKPEIVVFAGPNGSGKSTITNLLRPPMLPYINADEIQRVLDCDNRRLLKSQRIGVKSVWRSARGFALRPSCLLTETSNSSSEQKMLAFSFGVIMF